MVNKSILQGAACYSSAYQQRVLVLQQRGSRKDRLPSQKKKKRQEACEIWRVFDRIWLSTNMWDLMIHRGRELAMRQTDCGSQNTVSSLNHECGKYYRGFLRCDQPCQTSRILSKISLLITAKTGRHRVVYFEWLCNKLGIVIVNRI